MTRSNRCVDDTYVAIIRGRSIRRVTYKVDGRVVRRVTVRSGATRVRTVIDTSNLASGRHRLEAVVTFRAGSGTPARTLRMSLRRCANAQSPSFTG